MIAASTPMATRRWFGWLSYAGAMLALTAGCPSKTKTPPPPVPREQPRPTAPAIPNPFVQVSSRFRHTCALRKQGDISCWGKNTYGQLGNGNRTDSPRFVKVRGITGARHVEVGRDFSCAILADQRVSCWGNNEDGQLGDGRGAKPGAMSLQPVAVAKLGPVQALSLGHYHACALETGGAVKCWGNGANGQIGSDVTRAFAWPRVIPTVRNVTHVASGANHVCVREGTGIVRCWGRNTEGQMGDGKSGSRIHPVVVTGIEDAVFVASGDNHSCAMLEGGRVACWGDNHDLQLGPGAGSEKKQRTPVPVPELQAVVALAGGGRHTCVTVKTGRVMCWGANDEGQLGHIAAPSRRAQPTPVRGVHDGVGLGLGAAHSCAVRRTGEVVCWGDEAEGATGPNTLAMNRFEMGR